MWSWKSAGLIILSGLSFGQRLDARLGLVDPSSSTQVEKFYFGKDLEKISDNADCSNLEVTTVWDTALESFLHFRLDHDAYQWTISLTYDRPLAKLDCWQATVHSADWIHLQLRPLDFDWSFAAGTEVQLLLQPSFPMYTPQPRLIAGGSISSLRPTSSLSSPPTGSCPEPTGPGR